MDCRRQAFPPSLIRRRYANRGAGPQRRRGVPPASVHNAAPCRQFDVIVLGAGAAGLFCAGIAGQRGLRVLLLDHAAKVAEKIRISGGGRCNFTNRDCGAGATSCPRTRPSAARRWRATRRRDFIALVQRHGIAFHEKHQRPAVLRRLGRTDHRDAAGRMRRRRACSTGSRARCTRCATAAAGFELDTERGAVRAAPAGRRHRRPVDPEDRRQRPGLPPGAPVRPPRRRAAAGRSCR